MHGRGHAWRGGVHGRVVCMVGGMHGEGCAWRGHAWQEGMRGRRCAWQGACVAGGMHGGEMHSCVMKLVFLSNLVHTGQ